MSLSRTALVRGPALGSFRGSKFFTKEDFNIALHKDTINIDTSAHGKVDERNIEDYGEMSITTEGRFDANFINAFYSPYANMILGTSLVGFTATFLGTTPTITATNSVTDEPVVFNSADKQIHQLVAACLTKLPDLFLSAKKTMIGSATFRGVRGNALGWADANSIYNFAATGGSIADSTFTPAGIIVQPYTGVWGTVPGFTSFDTQEGWTINFNLKTKTIEIDSQGVCDVTFDGIDIMAKCTPVGPTAQNILDAAKIQGTGIKRGQSMQDDGSGGVTPDLVITGLDGTTVITLSACQLKTAGYGFGATRLRAGEVGFIATRKFSAGAQQPLFSMAVA